MRKVIHVCVVIILGFSYFGTIASTSGGLYLLDTIDNVSKTVTQKISNISVSYDDDKELKVGNSMADSYIAETSYTAYLFVNTGQENGKYVNSQTGKEEKFDDSKVLGQLNGNTFIKAKNSDRQNYLEELGNNADEDGEKDRWVSAVYDYLFIKFFYVFFKIIEATVIAIPIILVQILNLIAQLLVLIMMLLFPIALLISFIPRMQDIIFGVLKVMMGSLAFPAITSLLTLIIFYLEKIIENLVTSSFDNVIKGFASLAVFSLLFKLMIIVVAKALVYFYLWKYKGELIGIVLGSRARLKMDTIGNSVQDKWNSSKEIIQQVPNKSFSTAQNLGNFALASSGLASGAVINSLSHLKNARDYFSKAKPEEIKSNTDLEDRFKEETQSPQQEENTLKTSYQDEDTPSNVETTIKEPQLVTEEFSEDTSNSSSSTTLPNLEEEFETLKEKRLSPLTKRRINRLEKHLEDYKDTEAMYKAQGSNAFIKNYRKTLTRDDKLRANIKRKEHLTEELKRLRGEQ